MKKYEIDKLNFSIVTRNCLIYSGIKTIKKLSKTKASKLADIPGLGSKSLIEIKKILQDNNISMVWDYNEKRGMNNAKLVAANRILNDGWSIRIKFKQIIDKAFTRFFEGQSIYEFDFYSHLKNKILYIIDSEMIDYIKLNKKIDGINDDYKYNE